MGMYSTEKNVQILIAVLKANGIKKVVASAGTTHISFLVSLVNDGGFEIYSAVDERGAAYIACGLASESSEPVVITCTGATASRNYLPGLTEAYHRKLPILAVTASQDFIRSGNLSPQYIDRTVEPVDSVRISVQVPIVRSQADEYDATLKINKAVLELFRHGGGPAHINLASEYNNDFSASDLSWVRVMKRYTWDQALPPIRSGLKIAVAVGAHKRWTSAETQAVDDFCGRYDAVVIVDHSSHYWGRYRVLPTISTAQAKHNNDLYSFDLLIHIGEEHGDYMTDWALRRSKEVWRVSPDGELRDTYGKLTNVFEMSEEHFFRSYAGKIDASQYRQDALRALKTEIDKLYRLIPELPFSNIWLAQQTIPRFPADACLKLGVSNTMRAWTFFDFRKETYTLANTGCRGIDGAIPTLLGMSLVHPDQLYFAVMGDLKFFYSFNVLGNRHFGNNVRIMLVNNGCGTEFNLSAHRAHRIYDGDPMRINEFIAGGGHMGAKSRTLVKHYAEDLGFRYITASTKEEYLNLLPTFLDGEHRDQPIIFEVFTEPEQENRALEIIRHIIPDDSGTLKSRIKHMLGR